jgi:hypothetical protein
MRLICAYILQAGTAPGHNTAVDEQLTQMLRSVASKWQQKREPTICPRNLRLGRKPSAMP